MSDKAPQGGIRRNQFVVLVGGVHVTPGTIDIKVYKDHQQSPDAVLSAEAMANLHASEVGVYRYSYSVAGIASGTHLLEEIRIAVQPIDPLAIWHLLDCYVEGVVDSNVAMRSTDSVTLKLTGGSC